MIQCFSKVQRFVEEWARLRSIRIRISPTHVASFHRVEFIEPADELRYTDQLTALCECALRVHQVSKERWHEARFTDDQDDDYYQRRYSNTSWAEKFEHRLATFRQNYPELNHMRF